MQMRHTFANTLEADDKTRSDIMGHTNTTTTQTHYIKTNARKQLTALNKLQFTQVSRKMRKSAKMKKARNTKETNGRSERI